MTELDRIAAAIRAATARRTELMTAMVAWYGQHKGVRFPAYEELASVENRLADLDTHYKVLWDAADRQARL